MWLVGMMGSGKSTAGALAADLLGVRFYDTDEVVVEQVGCSIPEFWEQNGETAFRKEEKMATASLAGVVGIKATGGGVVLDADNRRVLTGSPPVVWLRAEPEELAMRLEAHYDRPLVDLVERPHLDVLTTMLTDRGALYEEVSTHRVATEGLGTTDVARILEEIWRD